MMDFQGLVERKLEPVGQSNEDIIYRCPQCEGDQGSGHLYVNYDKGLYNCFKCGFKGRQIEKLLKYLNIDLGYDYAKIYSEHDKELDKILIGDLKSSIHVSDPSTNIYTINEYYKHHTVPLSNTAYEYLLHRKLTPSMISNLGIMEGVNRYGELFSIRGKEYVGRDYSGRIMIPSLKKDGNITFYLGRDYIGDKSAKYINPPKELGAASEDVWSLDRIDTDSVVICEGVFTAISVNIALGKMIACATYGKSIAKKSSDSTAKGVSQGEKLLSKCFNSYIMFYDKDAIEESYKSASYLSDRGATVRVVKIPPDMYGPKADAGDMTSDEIKRLIMEAEPFDRFSEFLE